uniref:Abhydro_lipase domain-containing protein n=1 Tax=Haemonchus contortus TaxID=6289 RepID=A0A7I5ECI5_HAECO
GMPQNVIEIFSYLAILYVANGQRRVIPMEHPPNLLQETDLLFPDSHDSTEWPPLTTTTKPTQRPPTPPKWDPAQSFFPFIKNNEDFNVFTTQPPLFFTPLPPITAQPLAFSSSAPPVAQLPVFPPPTFDAQPPVFPNAPPFPQPPLLPPPPPPFPILPPPPPPPMMSQLTHPSAFARGPKINPKLTTIKPIVIDPEAIMSVPEIIRHWGYPVEEHRVVTADGYILVLHRIPHGKENGNSTAYRPVVFLQHGLLCTSSIWLLNLPHQSAGFLFADRGFDVWLGNMRGNVYSRRHVVLDGSSNDFWKFSWEEMAEHDLPAMIDYVLNATDQTSLYYVGHSQGTLTMLAKLSKDQEFSKKIRKFFSLAPVSRMSHVKGLFYYLGQIYEQFKLVYRLFGDNEFLSNNIFTRLLTDIICDKSVNNPLCENFIFSVSGPNSNQFNSSRIGIYLAHNPAGTSSRNMLHFAQMVHTKRMASFDRGPEGNRRWYHQTIPPEYDMGSVHCHVYLFYSDYDWLANAADVEEFLIPSLPKSSVKFTRRLKEFNHNDFLWGLRAREEIYDPITNIIKIDTRRLLIQKRLNTYFKTRRNDSTTMADLQTWIIANNTVDLDSSAIDLP